MLSHENWEFLKRTMKKILLFVHCHEPNTGDGNFLCLIDYDTLRALDSDDFPHASSMSEEEINALPVHKYKGHSDKGSVSNQR
jgi:hypothetical protein